MQQFKYLSCSKYCDHLNKFCDFKLTYQLVQQCSGNPEQAVLVGIQCSDNYSYNHQCPLNELLIGRSFFEFIRQILYLYLHI